MSLIGALVRLNGLPVWKREVRVWDRRFAAVSLDRLLNLCLHRLRVMGRADAAFLRAVVRPGMRVVDIGANQGLYTLLLSAIVGASGSVVAFEPDPELFEVLSYNCRTNSARNVCLYAVALGSTTGPATLARSLLNAGDNRLASGQRSEVVRRVQIMVATLDEIFGDSHVDFIKMDVQGWEWEALKGMARVLEVNTSLGIYFEFWPYGLTNAGCDPVALLNYLSERGFLIYECQGRQPRLLCDFAEFGKRFHGRRYTNLYAERKGGSSAPLASTCGQPL
jgi:FkbM family methyltransferase